MKNTKEQQDVINEYTKQIKEINYIDMEALSKLTTSAMSKENNPMIDELVDRIVKLSESISKQSRDAGHYVVIKNEELLKEIRENHARDIEQEMIDVLNTPEG